MNKTALNLLLYDALRN